MRRTLGVLACAGLLACTSVPVPVRSPQPMTPPMGWNSWNSGMVLTATSVTETIDAMVASGMRDAGYRYVNLDAGWAAGTRDADGRLRADPARFPAGIADLARYAHDRGMYLGIYHSPHNEYCGQDPRVAGAGHESVDAQTFAAWGVDYLKYDWCRLSSDHDEQMAEFTAMRDALRTSGRHIFYSINPNSSGDPRAGREYDWSAIADMSRNSIDVVPAWGDDGLSAEGLAGVAQAVNAAIPVAAHSKPTHINDPDMLVVGLGWQEFAVDHPTMSVGPPRADLSIDEQRAQFSLWAILAAPLLAGNDPRLASPQTRDILTNRDVIAVDQDPLMVQGRQLPGDPSILAKPLADGSVAVAMINPGDAATPIDTSAGAIGAQKADCYTVRDLWAHTVGRSTNDVGVDLVAPHGVAMLRVTPNC